MTRPSWDEVWMRCADAIALRSKCDLAKVGAIIVTADNRAMPPAYNGPPKGIPYQGGCARWCPRGRFAIQEGTAGLTADYSKCESIHAEANALLRADWSQIQGGTIYVTSPSCINCARLVANSGVTRLIHRVTADFAYRKPEEVEEFLRSAGLAVGRIG